MKAKDLAALAALGIAGKMAYDKFGNKTAPGKASPVYDYDSPAQKEQAVYDYDTPAQKEQVVYDYDTPVQKQKTAPVYDNDAPAQKQKAALIYDNDARPVASNGFKKVKTAAAATTAKRPIGENAAGSLFTRRDAVESAPAQTQLVYDNDAPVAQRLAALNAANGAASESARKTDALAVGSRANQAAYLEGKRNDQMAAAGSPSALATDALAVGSRANQAAYLEGKRNDQMAAAGSPSALATDALAVGSRANQAAYLKNKQDQALVPDYSNEGRNRAPVTALSRINETGGATSPSARATDALAVSSRANQAAYLAQQRAEQARIDALRSSGGRRAKGGVVKMAKGGLASSKMSKPSGASRGDGIAQRGRTRGTLR
jgi:hypothetical protein